MTDPDPPRTMRPGVPPALAVVGLALVVMVAAAGAQVITWPATLSSDGEVGLRVFGGLMVLLGIVGLQRERRRLADVRPRVGSPSVVALRTAATIMGVVAILASVNAPVQPDRGAGRGFRLPGGSPFGASVPGNPVDARTRGGDPMVRGNPLDGEIEELESIVVEADRGSLFHRVLDVFIYLFLLLLAYMALRNFIDRSWVAEHRAGREFRIEIEEAEAGLTASLAEVLEFGDDPRGRISAAYHRLLAVLSDAGAPREPYEAPHEHLYRVLGPLGVRSDSLHRLAEIYVLAQFSAHAVTDADQAAAAQALESSLADLRGGAGPHSGGGARSGLDRPSADANTEATAQPESRA